MCIKNEQNILQEFSSLEDPRQDGKKLHMLSEILLVTITSVICGAESWRDIVNFGKSKLMYLRKYLPYKHGIASKDTLQRMFALLNPEEFKACFLNWVQSICQLSSEIIPIDGKTLRRSFDRAKDKPAIQMVSAFARGAGLVLAQQKVDDDSNEITAIPKLLQLFELKGHIITIDAMGCQQEIAREIVDKGGDYVLSLKKNQLDLYEDAKLLIEDAIANDSPNIKIDKYQTTNGEHGRIEVRKYYATSDIGWLKKRHFFKNMKSIAMVESHRTANEHTSIQRRFYISSLPANAEIIGKSIRGHWAIENYGSSEKCVPAVIFSLRLANNVCFKKYTNIFLKDIIQEPRAMNQER